MTRKAGRGWMPGVASVFVIASIAAAWWIAANALLAQERSTVLHEPVPGLSPGAVLEFSGPNEAHLLHEQALIPKPGAEDDLATTPVLSASSLPFPQEENRGQLSPVFRPDKITDFASSDRRYHAAFSPSVAPHKRLSALDAVVMDGRVPVLAVRDRRSSPVAVDGTALSDGGSVVTDRFWGSVSLDFSDGARVPIPSVAPQARILAIETDPPVSLQIEKDSADNYFAVRDVNSEEAGLEPDTVRLTFLTDAAVDYFAPRFVPEAPTDPQSEAARGLPPEVRQQGLTFAAELGVRPGASYRHALETLTGHFRGFRQEEDENASGRSIFLDLARGGRGVCRHRAYAFVLTAMSLGIEARFVMNELHAWVEVLLPELGWTRIDLGGAIGTPREDSPQQRVYYEPRHPDPWPMPASYLETLARSRGAGASGQAQGGAAPSMGARSAASSGASATSTVSGGAFVPGGDSGRGVQTVSTIDFTEVGSDGPVAQLRVPLRLTLASRSYSAFRGGAIELAGRAETASAAASLENLRVEVFLLSSSEPPRPIGVCVTGANGVFSGSFGVPPDMPVGEYRLQVRTDGSDRFFPAEVR